MSTPNAPRRPSRAEVRRALLDAAARVFARRGIDAASLDEVAAEAGLTKGAIYSNFAGKSELVEAVVESNLRSNLDVGLAAVEIDGTMAERAQALGDALSGTIAGQREWHLLYVELWQRTVRATPEDERPGGTMVAHRRAMHDAITAAITAHAGETGTALPLPPDQLATVLIALWQGFSMESRIDPADVPHDLLGRVLALLASPSQGPLPSGSPGEGPG